MKRPLVLFIVLSISQPVLAYLEEDVQRLLETNTCEKCNLTEADLSNADLEYAKLGGADLTGADLRAADLDHANIDGSNFSAVDLSNGQLRNVNLRGAIFRGANLSNIDLAGVDLSGMDLAGAIMRNTILVGTNLSYVNLDGADLSSAYLYGASLINANLSKANLDHARLSGVDLTGANLVGATFSTEIYQQDEAVSSRLGIAVKAAGDYQQITSFDLSGPSKYMTSKLGQLYRSRETESSIFSDYVHSYPDLLVAFKKTRGISIEAWGGRHWEKFGKNESRSIRDLPDFEAVLDFNENPKFRSDQEVGLLSVAARDNLIYLSYTIKESDKDSWDDIFLVVDEYNLKLEKVRRIIKIRTASFAHVAGTLTFDRSGNLYLSVGEGRLSDYESQDINSLLGKILRIDVSKTEPKVKVIAYGLRNPWKISIDSKNRMFIGDCGEAEIESLYLLDDLDPAMPYNLGWPVFEGTKRRVEGDSLRFEDTLSPIYEYRHHAGIGICVIGGFFSDDLGIYVFGDYLGRIKFLKERENGDWYEIHSQSTRGTLSLGIDTARNKIYMSGWDEIYQLNFSERTSNILRTLLFVEQ